MGLFDKLLWGEKKKPHDECREVLRHFPGFVVSREFWSYNNTPLRAVFIDEETGRFILAGYYSFTHTDKANIYRQISDNLLDKQPALGYMARNNLAHKMLDDYIEENNRFARLYQQTDIIACELLENGEVVASAGRRLAAGAEAANPEVLGGKMSFKTGSEAYDDAVQVRIYVQEKDSYRFSITFAGYQKKDYQQARQSAGELYKILSAMLAQADNDYR